jgi:DNA repair exonuclease SbcCD ATPase subunit
MPLNPVIMDEPFEGLDATGREIVIELLNKLSMSRQIWVIDHMSESKSMFSTIVRIEKRNGISTIV